MILNVVVFLLSQIFSEVLRLGSTILYCTITLDRIGYYPWLDKNVSC
jgi:hypothetical protein